jgi:hypothetical protein
MPGAKVPDVRKNQLGTTSHPSRPSASALPEDVSGKPGLELTELITISFQLLSSVRALDIHVTLEHITLNIAKQFYKPSSIHLHHLCHASTFVLRLDDRRESQHEVNWVSANTYCVSGATDEL